MNRREIIVGSAALAATAALPVTLAPAAPYRPTVIYKGYESRLPSPEEMWSIHLNDPESHFNTPLSYYKLFMEHVDNDIAGAYLSCFVYTSHSHYWKPWRIFDVGVVGECVNIIQHRVAENKMTESRMIKLADGTYNIELQHLVRIKTRYDLPRDTKDFTV